MFKKWIFALLATLASFAMPALAETYYVAPIGAVIPGVPNGSLERPWPSTDAAMQSGKLVGGDTVLLMDGVHPMLRISTGFSSTVTFKSMNDRRARVDSIYIYNTAKNIRIQNLKVWSTNPNVHQSTLIYASSSTSDVDFINLDVRGGEDAYNYVNWTAAEWLARAPSGIMLDGTRQTVRQSNFTGVYFGIVLAGPDNAAIANRVDGYAGDGMRGNGHRGVFRDNHIENCVNVDGNHADGFQAFSNSSISGLVLERNRFIEWMHAGSHPLRCGLQGIGLFMGFYDDIRIINNVVAVRNGHGITVYGARGAQIINNTVVHIDGLQPGWPWIAIGPSNTGVPSTDVLVANNLAMGFGGENSKDNRVSFVSNRVVRIVNYAFPNWRNFEYEPRPDSRFIDAGRAEYAPELDINRQPRIQGLAPDLGAYEIGAAAAVTDSGAIAPPPVVTAESDAAEAAGGGSGTSPGSTGAKFLSAP